MTELPPSVEPFARRFAQVRSQYGPLVFGLDPAKSTLLGWDLPDTPVGLDQFVDIVLEAAVGTIGIVKPQSAFYERHGSKGIQSLERLVQSARALGLLVILDAKRGDVGSTNDAYADAYLDPGAPIAVDALTITPYLGLKALTPFLSRSETAGAGVFVVTRSSNPEGRSLQQAQESDGSTVEARIISELRRYNDSSAPGGVGPFGAVFGAAHGKAVGIDLKGMGGLFLCPGLGAQGTTTRDVADCFSSCVDRVLPSASRSLLDHGPDVAELRDAVASLKDEVIRALSP